MHEKAEKIKPFIKKASWLDGFTWGEFLGVVILLALVFIGPILLTLRCSQQFAFDQSSAYVGDTIGGLTAPFLNILAAFLVYKAFRAQIKANKKINKQIKISKKDSKAAIYQNNYEVFLIYVNTLNSYIENNFNSIFYEKSQTKKISWSHAFHNALIDLIMLEKHYNASDFVRSNMPAIINFVKKYITVYNEVNELKISIQSKMVLYNLIELNILNLFMPICEPIKSNLGNIRLGYKEEKDKEYKQIHDFIEIWNQLVDKISNNRQNNFDGLKKIIINTSDK